MSADLVALARRIATEAHAGQVDKSGQPYIGHVERVAARLSDPHDQAVAWLHDVLEDTGRTYQDLVSGDSRPWSWGAVSYDLWRGICMDAERLTHRPHEPRARYYERIRGSDRAVRVKLADIADNTDPARLAALDEPTRARLVAKYTAARQALGADQR